MNIKPDWVTQRVTVTYPSGAETSYPMVAIEGTLYYYDVWIDTIVNLDEVEWEA